MLYFCQLMIYNNVIVDITSSRDSFVFRQSRVKSSASLTNVGSLAIGAFDLVSCSLSVVGFVSKCRNVFVGLSATRML